MWQWDKDKLQLREIYGRILKIQGRTVTYYLSLRASKVKEHHANSVIRGHSKTLKGLLEENAFPDTHLFCEQ